MRVYILVATCNKVSTVTRVFTSHASMLTWLKVYYDYNSEIHPCIVDTYGKFKEPIRMWEALDREYDIHYEVHEVCGEHCPRTDKLNFT